MVASYRFKDLTGKRIGQLVVGTDTFIKADSKGRTQRYWICTCDCGETKAIRANSLTAGHSKSCGCSRRGKRFVDLTSKTYGRWRVLGHYGVTLQGKDRTERSRAWRVLCDPKLGGCGKIRVVLAGSLRTGKSTSCGCRRREVAQKRFQTMHYVEKQLGAQAFAGLSKVMEMERSVEKRALDISPQ
jgi:hypothetical protein